MERENPKTESWERKHLRELRKKHDLPNGLEVEGLAVKQDQGNLEEMQKWNEMLEAKGSTRHKRVVQLSNGKLVRLEFTVRK